MVMDEVSLPMLVPLQRGAHSTFSYPVKYRLFAFFRNSCLLFSAFPISSPTNGICDSELPRRMPGRVRAATKATTVVRTAGHESTRSDVRD